MPPNDSITRGRPLITRQIPQNGRHGAFPETPPRPTPQISMPRPKKTQIPISRFSHAADDIPNHTFITKMGRLTHPSDKTDTSYPSDVPKPFRLTTVAPPRPRRKTAPFLHLTS